MSGRLGQTRPVPFGYCLSGDAFGGGRCEYGCYAVLCAPSCHAFGDGGIQGF
jgi:hypothetical protein